jgi:hypothetical protein
MDCFARELFKFVILTAVKRTREVFSVGVGRKDLVVHFVEEASH